MEDIHLLDCFRASPRWRRPSRSIFWGRIGLILLGFLLIYLGHKGVLEALLMIPMGLGMAAVNAGVMVLDAGRDGHPVRRPAGHRHRRDDERAADRLAAADLHLHLQQRPDRLLVFLGIGVLLDVGFVMARPFQSMFIAIFAELGTIVTFPLGGVAGHGAEARRRRWRLSAAPTGRWCCSRR